MEHKEDLASGGDAAVMGGVTTVFEMPNTNPPTTSQEALNHKLARAKGRMRCDHAFFMGATPENADEIGDLADMAGCCGVKVFMGSSTGSLLVAEDGPLERVFCAARRRIAIHAEDETILDAGRRPSAPRRDLAPRSAQRGGGRHRHPAVLGVGS